MFKLHSKYSPSGDQPKAIEELVHNCNNNTKNQVLQGITGSGKTFTMANVIKQLNRPTLIMSPNKMLAAQLYSEMCDFFPENAVEYFISYFDYYQPEAYIASSDTFIEKDSAVNPKLEQLKLSSIYSLLERKDTIVIASVSCIYGIGSPSHYKSLNIHIKVGDTIDISKLCRELVGMQYERNEYSTSSGCFRVKGDTIEIFPAHSSENAIKISFFGDEVESILSIDTLTFTPLHKLESIRLYSASLYATPREIINNNIPNIKQELTQRVEYFKQNNRFIEAQRLEERVNQDLEMLLTTGHCKGIEHYTRYFNPAGENNIPFNLFSYLEDNGLLIVDESHIAVPQINAMYNGDRNRKQNLVEYGFRLPSCLDNRPLSFDEWETLKPQTIFVSATPGPYELEQTQGIVTEQILRPTGLLDPKCIVKPLDTQVDDLIHELKAIMVRKEKALIITLTKKMSEHLNEYLNEQGIRTQYLHSDIDTLTRVEIINNLRNDQCDAVIGINLLREGLNIPECSLVAILDADKEGFLRSETSLIQTIGRAARNVNGKVILYANNVTGAMKRALDITNARREMQEKWNQDNNIIPKTVDSSITNIENNSDTIEKDESHSAQSFNKSTLMQMSLTELTQLQTKCNKEMLKHAEDLEFEKAIILQKQIKLIDSIILQYK